MLSVKALYHARKEHLKSVSNTTEQKNPQATYGLFCCLFNVLGLAVDAFFAEVLCQHVVDDSAVFVAL